MNQEQLPHGLQNKPVSWQKNKEVVKSKSFLCLEKVNSNVLGTSFFLVFIVNHFGIRMLSDDHDS